MKEFDLRGIRCPVSTMRLKKFLKTTRSGDTVSVLTDDDEARTDFPAMIKRMNAELIKFTDGVPQIYTIRMG